MDSQFFPLQMDESLANPPSSSPAAAPPSPYAGAAPSSYEQWQGPGKLLGDIFKGWAYGQSRIGPELFHLEAQQQREARLAHLQDRQAGIQAFQSLSSILGMDLEPKTKRALLGASIVQLEQSSGKPFDEGVKKVLLDSTDQDRSKIFDYLSTVIGVDQSVGAQNLIDSMGSLPKALELVMKGAEIKSKRDENEQAAQAIAASQGQTYTPSSGTAPLQAPTQAPRTPTARPEMLGPTRYKAAVEEEAKRQGIPPAFASAVMTVESGGNPRAVSSKGAQGVMQLMPATGQQYGVQDPFNAQENIRGGVAFLADLWKKYDGNPRLVAAAYNAGPGRVDQFGGVPPIPETQAYVKRVTGLSGMLDAQSSVLDSKIEGVQQQLNSLLGFSNQNHPKIKARVDQLQQERQSLIQQRDQVMKRQERAEEIPRAIIKEQALAPIRTEEEVRKQAALEPGKIRVAQAEGENAMRISVEKEQTKPIGPNAREYVHVDTLNHPPMSANLRDISASGDYVPIGDAQQKDLREKKSSAQSLFMAVNTMEDLAQNNPKIWNDNIFNAAVAVLKNKTGVARLDPETRKVYAQMDAIRAARARFARAFGDVGNIAEIEQRVQEEALGLAPGLRDVALTRLGQYKGLLGAPLADYFKGLGLNPPSLDRQPAKLSADEILRKELGQ